MSAGEIGYLYGFKSGTCDVDRVCESVPSSFSSLEAVETLKEITNRAVRMSCCFPFRHSKYKMAEEYVRGYTEAVVLISKRAGGRVGHVARLMLEHATKEEGDESPPS